MSATDSELPSALSPPDFGEIEAAAARIAGVCTLTPLVEAPALSARVGGRVLIKAEGLQRLGSFKLRGAFNRMSQLTATERQAGVVAFSSGNHAQAVAYAARLLAVAAVIVMPADAPHRKIARTRELGAEVILYDRTRGDREAIAGQLCRDRGLTLIPPYEDRDIIAGAGTLGREVILEARERGLALEALLVPCSGGGLTAGCALAAAALSPATGVYAVEPADFDDTCRSLAAGERVSNEPGGQSICDALLVATPGALTFSINRDLLAGGLAVTDAETIRAVRFGFAELGLVIEPGAAVALAAVLGGRFGARGGNIAVVLSGSNVDAGLYGRLIEDRG